MKKKMLTVSLMLMLSVALASCDFLSSLKAVTGFYKEYQEYSAIYEEATQYTVLTETDLTISDTNIDDIDETHARVYVMFDQNSDFLYVEQTLGDVSQKALYEDAENLYVEYLIEGDVVTPSLPAAEDRYDGSTTANILNENFSYEDVSGENSPETHVYEFDIYLNQAINLDALTGFVDQLAIFGGDLTSFDNAVAHVTVSFVSEESQIDVSVQLTDYTITFEDSSYVTLSLTNHTLLMIPTDFAFPDVFHAPYQMVAVDNIQLARRIYDADETIDYPATASQAGWVQVYLEPGIYQVDSEHLSDLTFELKDPAMDPFNLDSSMQFRVVEAGSYYMSITPAVDMQMDVVVVTIEDHSTTGGTSTDTTESPNTDTTSTPTN